MTKNLKQNPKVQHLKKLESKLKTAETVAKLIETEGWQDIIQPLLDKMITDIDSQLSSKKIGYFWQNGTKATPKTMEDKNYYRELLHYKQALLDFHNRVWNYIAGVDRLRAEIGRIKASGRDKTEYKNSMLKGKYAV